jgi:hypothetical protein
MAKLGGLNKKYMREKLGTISGDEGVKIDNKNQKEVLHDFSELESIKYEMQVDEIMKINNRQGVLLTLDDAKEIVKKMIEHDKQKEELVLKHPEFYKNRHNFSVSQNQMEREDIDKMIDLFDKFAPNKPSVPGSWFNSCGYVNMENRQFITSQIAVYDENALIHDVGLGIVDPEKKEYWEDLDLF